MRILYDATDGRVYYAISDRDWPYFSHTTNIPLTEKVIDEVDGNKALYIDLLRTVGKSDADGQGKYYIDTFTGNLMEREGWREAIYG